MSAKPSGKKKFENIIEVLFKWIKLPPTGILKINPEVSYN